MRKYIFLIFFPFLFLNNFVQANLIESHYLKVEIDPDSRKIDVNDRVTLRPVRGDVRFTINKNLLLRSVKSGGKDLRYETFLDGHKRVIKIQNRKVKVIDLSYGGIIYDEIKKEKDITFVKGDITSGLISKEGVFLSPDSNWYPDEEDSLSVFNINVRIKGGLKVITQGELIKREYKNGEEYTEWRSKIPTDGLVLVASRYEIKTREINGIRYSTYLSKENSHLSDIFIEGSRKYIEFYSKILGRYPYRDWSVVENFFSSGYGMPGFTLLDPLVIKQGERILKPGYIDHEIVHSWWGNFVYPDYKKGNWAEAITTYLTNYYYKEAVLGENEAKRHRINTIEKYSIKVAPEKEYPLRRFVSKKEDFENEIGYGKGSMVFHGLRRFIGNEGFFNTLKSIVNRYGGKRASWDDLRSEFEKIYGKSLSSFFQQWLDRVQGPKLRLKDVTLEVRDKGYMVKGVVLQEGDLYSLDLPVAIFTEEAIEWFSLKIEEKEKKFSFITSEKPQTIEIDPDYHIFRIISQKDLHPCLNLFLERRNKYYLILGEDRERESFHALVERFKGDRGGEIIFPSLIRGNAEGDVKIADYMKKGSIFILGKPDINIPAKSLIIGDRDFIFRGKKYDRPSQAILYSLRNPYNEEEILTIYFGNSPEATTRARYLPYYGNDSYVIFDSGQPVERGYLERDRTDTRFIFGVLDKKSIERHVRFLASDKMKGRLPGTTEDKKVREYLSDRLREHGFRVYEQIFKIESGDVKQKKLKTPVNFPIETGNVIGVIEGERYIILSAHHDHHGIDKEGNIYYGADDNASGVSAVLEIAKELSRHQFKKGIIVIFPGAEEWGLLGSRFYVRDPIVPVDKVIAVLNIDSIGRGDNTLYIVGSSIYPELAGISRKYIVKKGLLEGKDIDRYAFKEGSDHYSFHEAGIPSIDFFSSDYKMIDMPGDDPDKIDFDKIKRIGEVVYQTAFELLVK